MSALLGGQREGLTVGELIVLLQQYDPDLPVEYFDDLYGHQPVTNASPYEWAGVHIISID